MKKTIVSLLILSIVLSFCGCNTKNEPAEFNDAVVFEDNSIKLEVVKFFEQDVNWTNGKQNEKCVAFKLTNKTNHYVSLSSNKFYIADEEMYVCLSDGNRANEFKSEEYYVYYVGHKKGEEHKALESIKRLYDLKGSVSVYHAFKEDSSKNHSQKIDFDFNLLLE